MKILFGDKLRKLRESRLLTQGEVAHHLGCTPKMISNYELNKREPDLETFRAICDLYDVTADYLLSRSNQEKYFYQSPLSGIQQELLNYFKLVPDEAKDDIIKYAKMQAVMGLAGIDDYQQMLRLKINQEKSAEELEPWEQPEEL